ncbi:hypothetical protein [Caproicibacter fermentans]|uniref:Uncharacterized protein n=1 Tax=Caproicibacter fermentans TaxID=2576756 RepID=A0A7G8TD76_9FIRM|nr:hypothetical protein [Caproicibacter fermentans]QNK41567.1 hypothetical protein HCR03_04700 [Caproicibacter fermentans]
MNREIIFAGMHERFKGADMLITDPKCEILKIDASKQEHEELNSNNSDDRDMQRLLQITYGIRNLNDDLSQAVDQFLDNSDNITQESVERLKESMIDNLIKGAHYQRLLDLFQEYREKKSDIISELIGAGRNE